MSKRSYSHATKLSIALAAALTLAACGSPEQRAQRYYEDGMKLLAAHEDAKAAVEFRNALRLKNNLLPAWRGLAQTEEDTGHLQGLVPISEPYWISIPTTRRPESNLPSSFSREAQPIRLSSS